MEEKTKRHGFLTRLLSEKPFSSQEDVVSAMKGAGYEVTQSSVSRDFREIGVIKVAGRYTPSSSLKGDAKQSTIQRMILGFDTAGPYLVVIKTTSGAANAVAQEIDNNVVPGIAGTVAGDDTIFVATKNKTAQARIIEHVKRLR